MLFTDLNILKIWLNKNQIKTLNSKLFKNLKQLKELYLGNNLMLEIDERLFISLVNLTHLELNYYL